MSNKILVIDPGHEGNLPGYDPGAVGNGLIEAVLTLDISKRIKKYLDDNYSGVTVLLTRTGNKKMTLSQRAKFANDRNADLFVSIHINAGGGTGYESFIHTSNSSGSRNAQNSIHSEAIKGMKVRDRGKKRANFAVLRQTKMPAILPENLFIDRKEDAAKLKKASELQKIAEGHAVGIAKALGLTKNKPGANKDTTVKKQNTPKNSSSNKKSTTKKYTSVVDYLKDNKMDASYKNRQKLAIQYGIKAYRGTETQNIQLLKYLQSNKSKQATSTKKYTPKSYKVGSKVKIKSNAKTYSRSTAAIPARYKNKTYTIQQVSKDDVLIRELYSWVRKSDLV